MKKALVTLAVGDKHAKIEQITGPFRRYYALKHGWEYIVLDQLSGDIEGEDAKACVLYKFMIPTLFSDYDMVAFMDADTVVNPTAPCLTDYMQNIPPCGFAAGQTVSFEKRHKIFPDWDADYYLPIERALGKTLFIPDRRTHINAGLLIFRPQEVCERWKELYLLQENINEEQRLNLYEVQERRFSLLPREWHVLWQYHRAEFYPFLYFKPGHYPPLLTKFALRPLARIIEQQFFLLTLQRNFLVHCAFEASRLKYLINFTPEEFASRAAKALTVLENCNISS